MGKLGAIFNVVNKNLTQFEVHACHISIDEQMMSCCGRHLYKMFIKGKTAQNYFW